MLILKVHIRINILSALANVNIKISKPFGFKRENDIHTLSQP